MLDFARKTFLGLAAVLAMAITGPSAQAATVVVEDGVYDIGYGDAFVGVVTTAGGAGVWRVQFDAVVDPLLSGATATISNLMLSNFTGLTMSWVAVSDSFLLADILVTPPEVSLATAFTSNGVKGGDDISQWLVFSWSNSVAGSGFDFEVQAAAVPLPAGGLLLIGALGGLAVLRRRKTA